MILMDLERQIKPNTPKNPIQIRKWVLRSISKRSKKIIEDKNPSFTASTFTRLLEEIEAEVTEDYLTYSVAMPKEVDVGRTSLRVYYDVRENSHSMVMTALSESLFFLKKKAITHWLSLTHVNDNNRSFDLT